MEADRVADALADSETEYEKDAERDVDDEGVGGNDNVGLVVCESLLEGERECESDVLSVSEKLELLVSDTV